MANCLRYYVVCGALIFHLAQLTSVHYRVKRRCSKLQHNAVMVKVSCKISNDLISIQ